MFSPISSGLSEIEFLKQGQGELPLSRRAASLAMVFQRFCTRVAAPTLRWAASNQREVQRRRASKTRRVLPHDDITCETRGSNLPANTSGRVSSSPTSRSSWTGRPRDPTFPFLSFSRCALLQRARFLRRLTGRRTSRTSS